MVDKLGTRSNGVNSDQEAGDNGPTTSANVSQEHAKNEYVNQAFDLQENKLSQQSNNNKNIKFNFDNIKPEELSETSF